jgi:hypothetical protein
MGLEHRTFDIGTAWDRFGQDMAALSSGFEVAFDGWYRDRKLLGDLALAGSGIDGSQHPEQQILRIGFHAHSLA